MSFWTTASSKPGACCIYKKQNFRWQQAHFSRYIFHKKQLSSYKLLFISILLKKHFFSEKPCKIIKKGIIFGWFSNFGINTIYFDNAGIGIFRKTDDLIIWLSIYYKKHFMKRSYLCRIWHYCYSIMSLRQQVYRVITVFMSHTEFCPSKSSSLHKIYAAYGITWLVLEVFLCPIRHFKYTFMSHTAFKIINYVTMNI